MAPNLQLVTDYFGKDREPRDIFKVDIEFFKAWLVESRNKSENSVRLISDQAKAWWSWMIFYDIVAVNPWKKPYFMSRKEYKYIADFPRV